MTPARTPFTHRANQAAVAWQKEKCADLQALIYIQERLLVSYREELEKLRSLEGPELLSRYGWESPESVAKLMEKKHTWIVELGYMWIDHAGKRRSV